MREIFRDHVKLRDVPIEAIMTVLDTYGLDLVDGASNSYSRFHAETSRTPIDQLTTLPRGWLHTDWARLTEQQFVEVCDTLEKS
jgi:hypothetical protein